MNQLKSEEKLELIRTAAYIRSLPPTEPWEVVRQYLPPQPAENIQHMWSWLGLSLHAFFNDEPNPLPNSELSQDFQNFIEEKSTEYIGLSALIFQAERFLRREASNQGLDFTWNRRSDILRRWAYEHCRYGILLWCQEYWETDSEQKREKQFRKIRAHVLGDLNQKEFDKLRMQWQADNAKLSRPKLDPSQEMPFTAFCVETFCKYRTQLPAFEPWVNCTTKDYGSGLGKIRFFNGEIHLHSGRGPGRAKKKSF